MIFSSFVLEVIYYCFILFLFAFHKSKDIKKDLSFSLIQTMIDPEGFVERFMQIVFLLVIQFFFLKLMFTSVSQCH